MSARVGSEVNHEMSRTLQVLGGVRQHSQLSLLISTSHSGNLLHLLNMVTFSHALS
jgi:hypothetical protein